MKIVTQTPSIDTIKSILKKNKKIKRIVLKSNTKKELKNWKEYQLVDEILSKFNSISNEEALSNAKELSEFVTHLKDSITDKRLKSPPLKSRINILHNECLRLNDMAEIPAISTEEVSAEIDNIFEAYNAFNAKLNDIFKVRNMENELELDPDFESILNDSSRVPIPEKFVFDSKKKQPKRINRSKIDFLKREKNKAIKTIK
ncbi:MAG TPA: hypothetical protein EYG92_05075 [Lutibacter sp.]|nr:hypothetical protein [Lutibacter sp.]